MREGEARAGGLVPRKKASVFERLGRPEAQVMKRIATKRRISLTPEDATHLPVESFTAGRNDAKASSSRGKLSNKQRRKLNAKLRAQHSLPELPAIQQSLELVATVSTQNKFANLKWVKWNSSTGEFKQLFWVPPQRQTTVPQRKEPEIISTRAYRVLKVVKERRLMKKKFQQSSVLPMKRAYASKSPLLAKGQETLRQSPRDECRSLKFRPRVQQPVVEKAKDKGKQIWRPKSREEGTSDKEKVVMPSLHFRKPTSSKSHQEWIPKRGIHIEDPYDG